MTLTIDQSHHSPNFGSRNGRAITMIVLHATVGSAASALAWLTNPASRVSSHYVITKSGTIYQLVSDSQAAWHAGVSAWQGLDSVAIEEVSLGVELENANDGRDPYPSQQLASAHALCQSLIARYNIERADVVRHLDIAIPHGRKTDPAGLPWPAFADSLYMDAPPGPSHPPGPPLRTYRVLSTVTGGATIRSAPRTNAAVLGRLHAGDAWVGEAIDGQLVTLAGFGSSNQWIRALNQACVWKGLLEEVKP